MKTNYLVKRVLLPVLLLFTLQAKSQVPLNDSTLSRIFDTDILIPMLFDSALKINPTIRRADRNIEMLGEISKASKKDYLKGISFISSYSYGNVADLSLTKDPNSTPDLNTFRSSKSDRYNVGINVQIPITYLINRKNNVRTTVLQVKMAEAERDDHVLYIENEIIRLYQELKLNHRQVMTSSKNKQSSLVNYKMIEKEFLQGNINLEGLSRLYDMYNKSVVEHDSYVNRFETSFLQLQLMIGTSLSDLINKVK